MKLIKHIEHADNDLEGILYFFYSTYGQEKYYQIFNVSASSTLVNCNSRSSYSCSPSAAIDFNSKAYWHPQINEIGQYVQIEIKNGWIFPEGYVIQTSNFGAGGSHPKNWAVSTSRNGKTWTNKEEYSDTNNCMNSNFRSKYLEFRNKGAFRFFRIYTNGVSYAGHNKMDVNQIEFFGKFYEGTLALTNQVIHRNNIAIAIALLCIIITN